MLLVQYLFYRENNDENRVLHIAYIKSGIQIMLKKIVVYYYCVKTSFSLITVLSYMGLWKLTCLAGKENVLRKLASSNLIISNDAQLYHNI